MKTKSLYTVKVDENIELRIRTQAEAKELFDLVDGNRKHLRVFLNWVDRTKSVSDSKNFIKKVAKGYESGESCDFGIYYNGVMVGSGGFHYIDQKNRNGEIGYWIAKDYEGKGIVTKCVEKFVEIGKKKYKLHRIVIKMLSLNIRSRAIPERLKFKFEGTMRDNYLFKNKFQSTEIWSLLV